MLNVIFALLSIGIIVLCADSRYHLLNKPSLVDLLSKYYHFLFDKAHLDRMKAIGQAPLLSEKLGNANLSSSAGDSKQSGCHDAKSPIFAFIIGIDNYQISPKLRGAVADAEDVETYLKEKLDVPQDHIRKLCNEEATRQAFIKGFRDLQEDSRIKKNNTIFIYFAGHGSEKKAPDGWHAEGGKIQLIVPQDAGTTLAGQRVNAIADRTIGVLLEDLAKAKGNNITVILDCCHSHSGSRDDGSTRRFAEIQGDLPPELDSDIVTSKEGRSPFIDPTFAYHGLRSHVLLSACASGESAWETNGRGDFTTALIATLRTLDAGIVTYKDLVEKLPKLPRQNPHCEGYHKDRRLFNIMTASAYSPFVEINQDGDTYTLMAGRVHGVSLGSQFTVYADRTNESRTNPPLCTLRVANLEPTQTTLEPLDGDSSCVLPNPAYAQQIRYGSEEKLNMCFADEFDKNFVQEVLLASNIGLSTDGEDNRFLLTNANEAAVLVDVHDEGSDRKAVFSTRILHAKHNGFERLALSVPADDALGIADVLRSVAHWNWHFRRQGSQRFGSDLSLEFYRLRQGYDDFDGQYRLVWEPAEPAQNLNLDDAITVIADPKHRFGAKIINNTTRDLYPYLFYFGVKYQNILDYKLGSAGKDKVDAPLRAKSYLTVGYGATGGVPFTFKFREEAGEGDQLGFFKIFLTTSPAELGSLIQTSPFEPGRAPFSQRDLRRKLENREFYTITVAVAERANLRTTK